MKHIFTGNGAPTSTPTEVAQHYVDLTNHHIYISKDTTSSGDWVDITAAGGGGGLTYVNLGTAYAGSTIVAAHNTVYAGWVNSPGATAITFDAPATAVCAFELILRDAFGGASVPTLTFTGSPTIQWVGGQSPNSNIANVFWYKFVTINQGVNWVANWVKT